MALGDEVAAAVAAARQHLRGRATAARGTGYSDGRGTRSSSSLQQVAQVEDELVEADRGELLGAGRRRQRHALEHHQPRLVALAHQQRAAWPSR